MSDKPTVSPLVWFAYTFAALGALLLSFVLIDGEGFLGPFMFASALIGLLSLVLAIVGTARSARRWPGMVAVLVSGLLAFAFPLFLLIAVLYSVTLR